MNYKPLVDLALLALRVYYGYQFIPSGWTKMMKGQPVWLWLGQQMGNLGIHFAPVFWGFAAMAAELFGGIALLFGFGTRIASLLLAFTMFVATVMHVKNGDPFAVYVRPLAYMIGLIVIAISGAGDYSIDHWLWKK